MPPLEAAAAPPETLPGSDDDVSRTERLLHELSVHQAELEIQNEQLRQAQIELETSRDRFADLFEQAPVGFVTLDHGDVISAANRMAGVLLGLPPSRLIGQRFHGFVAPEEQARLRRAQAKMLRLEGPQRLEVRLAPKVDPARWVALEMVVLHDGQGVSQCRTAIIDISARVRMQDNESRLAAIVSSTDDAVISRDAEGLVTSWNDAAARMFGRPAAEMIGRAMDALVPAGRRNEEVQLLRRLRAGERIVQLETERLHASGVAVPLSVTLSPVRNAGGAVIGSALIARDISERVRADAALRTRLRQLDALSHVGEALILGKTDVSPMQQELFERVADAVNSEVQLNYAASEDGAGAAELGRAGARAGAADAHGVGGRFAVRHRCRATPPPGSEPPAGQRAAAGETAAAGRGALLCRLSAGGRRAGVRRGGVRIDLDRPLSRGRPAGDADGVRSGAGDVRAHAAAR